MQENRIIELIQELKSIMLGKAKTDPWLDIKKASEYANCSAQTLRRAINDGNLKASKSKLRKILMEQFEMERRLLPLKLVWERKMAVGKVEDLNLIVEQSLMLKRVK